MKLIQINSTLTSKESTFLRLLVGGLFGLIIAWLSNNVIEETTAVFIVSFLFIVYELKDVLISTFALSAFVIWAGAGTMRRYSLFIWSFVALGLIAFVSWTKQTYAVSDATAVFIFPFLFIAHELISSADQSGKLFASYALYFDQAWKRSIQLILAFFFTSLFWSLLWLGGLLLGFIGFHWFQQMLENSYFWWIASGLAMASAVQLGDVQPHLLVSIRTIVLGVLAWLLPVITLVGVIFVISLCFSGLAPLWATKAATLTLLAACVMLILLINAVYQQGNEPQIILKWAVLVASLLLLILASLAIFSLYLRIQQYGFTPERVRAFIGVVIAFLFGLGYSIAVFLPGRWMHAIQYVNIRLAVFNMIVFFAILTPWGDPARLSVLSQVARLQSGIVKIEQFDWKFLHSRSSVWGKRALDNLTTSGKTEVIRSTAAKVRAMKDLDDNKQLRDINRKPDSKYLNIVFPKGGKLPESFLNQVFLADDETIPDCLKNFVMCDVAIIDLNDDKKLEILFVDQKGKLFFFFEKNGSWSAIYTYIGEHAQQEFKRGNLHTKKPKWNDLYIGEEKIHFH